MPHTVSQSIQTLLKAAPKPLQLHEPSFTGQEHAYVKECIDTGWVSSAGVFVDRFEKAIADYTGLHAVLTVNGTAALHLCYRLAGIEAGDEVLMPTLTFVATANALSYCGATPHFIDSEKETLGADPEKLRDYLENGPFEKTDKGLTNTQTQRRIKALVVMHAFGHPAKLDSLKSVCDEFKLALIEDSAESFGSFYKSKHTGRHGVLSALSFNGNKIITTGGGGAVLTADPHLAARAKHISTTARTPGTFQHHHDEIGYNYRMPNINAAIGLAQMETLGEQLEKKRILAQKYQQIFANLNSVHFVPEPPDCKSNHWLNTLIMRSRQERDDLIKDLAANGIFCRAIWAPLHTLPMYKDCPHMDLSTSTDVIERAVSLPSSAFLADYL